MTLYNYVIYYYITILERRFFSSIEVLHIISFIGIWSLIILGVRIYYGQ